MNLMFHGPVQESYNKFYIKGEPIYESRGNDMEL